MQHENKNTSITSPAGVQEGKQTAAIAYLTLIGLIIAFVINNEKKNAFAAYHIRQSLGLMCTGLALSFVNVIPVVGWIVSILGSIVLLIFWVMGLVNAVNGKQVPVPVLGDQYNKWFEGIK